MGGANAKSDSKGRDVAAAATADHDIDDEMNDRDDGVGDEEGDAQQALVQQEQQISGLVVQLSRLHAQVAAKNKNDSDDDDDDDQDQTQAAEEESEASSTVSQPLRTVQLRRLTRSRRWPPRRARRGTTSTMAPGLIARCGGPGQVRCEPRRTR